MDFYSVNLAVFASVNAFLLYRQYHKNEKETNPSRYGPLNAEVTESRKDEAAARRFKLGFLLPYALAVAADWMQGPHIYAIYKYEKGIAEKTVAALYAAGFVSGGISASFAGSMADRYGRKKACLLYCGLYVLTCLTMFSDNLLVLFLGRLCGGVCTTLLFSVFEAWMISDYHQADLQNLGLDLGSVFGSMTTINGVAAIISGVVGDLLVNYFGTRTWPFAAAILCCLGAAYLISYLWKENFGSVSNTEKASLQDVKNGIRDIVGDPKILSLGITSCVFEGTMYLFIFFWSAALKSVHSSSDSNSELPFGIIFSSFMCAMMMGSTVFAFRSSAHDVQSTSSMMMVVTILVSCCLSLAAMLKSESLLFWTLCLLEGCVGAYFPSIAYLKSELIADGIRGRVYSILRFPLNVFVVVAHSLDQEALLIMAFIVTPRSFS